MVEVVTEASIKMKDPNYSAVMVGGFVQGQAAACQYITAHQTDVGGAEGVVNTIFHSALIGLAFQRAANRSVPNMSFEDLDRVSGDDVKERLETLQPSVYDYISTNVEQPAMQRVLCLIALAMDNAS